MKYEKNVYKSLIKYFLIVFVILSLIIIFLYYFVFKEADKNKAYKDFLAVDEAVDEFLLKNENFLIDNTRQIENFINGNDKELIEKAYEHRNDLDINFLILAFDKSYELTNSFSIRDSISKENYQYIEILLKNFGKNKYYSYTSENDNNKLIYIKNYKNGSIIFQVKSNDLAKLLNLKSKDYILTNKFDRILFKGSNIKYDNRKLNLEDFGKGYIVYSSKKNDFNLFVIKENFFTRDIFLMILLILSLISLVYVLVISVVTKKISREISHSLNYLINQINLVSQGKIQKININSDDEIKYISENINTLIDNIKRLEANNIALKYEKKAADFKTMESQFDPHFLYNTLDIISYQMYVDQDSCQKLISNLSKILRYSINNMSFVYLEEDLEYVRLYMEIQKIKHEDSLVFSSSIDPSLYNIMVPKLFIQPVLENSLKYGFENRKNLHINLDIYQKGDMIFIEIKDSGKALSLERIIELNKQIEDKSKNSFLTDDHHGLENSLKRLKILYKDAKLEFIEDDMVLVRISFRGKDESTDS